MTLRYLLDTDIVSEPLRPRPDDAVMEHLREHDAEIAIGSPVWHELWFGCLRLSPSRRRKVIESYLRDVVATTLPVLAYDAPAAAWHANERARLTGKGRPPPFVDGQIAAIAAINGLVLVSANVSHYGGFADLEVENWRA